MLVATYIVCQ